MGEYRLDEYRVSFGRKLLRRLPRRAEAVFSKARASTLAKRLGFVGLATFGALFASLYINERPAQAASLLTSARQGSNLVLSLDYSSRYPDDIHRLDYTTLTAGQSCPSWEVIRHAGYDRVNFLNSQGFVSPDYQHTHSIPLSSTTTRVCAVMVWGPSLNTNSNDDNEHFLIEIDITPPLILVHVDNSNSDRPRYFPVADEAIQTDRFGKEAWSFAVGEDRNCQTTVGGYNWRRGSTFTATQANANVLDKKFICFRASDTASNRGIGSRLINIKPISSTIPSVAKDVPSIGLVSQRTTWTVSFAEPKKEVRLEITNHNLPDPQAIYKKWSWVPTSRTLNWDCARHSGWSLREFNGTGSGHRYATILIPQSLARTHDICVRAVNIRNQIGYLKVNLTPNRIHLKVIQFLRDGKVTVQAHTNYELKVDPTKWRYAIGGSANHCQSLSKTELFDFNYKTWARELDVPPSTSTQANYICVKAEVAGLPVAEKWAKVKIIQGRGGGTPGNGLPPPGANEIACNSHGFLFVKRLNNMVGNGQSNVYLELKLWNPNIGPHGDYMNQITYSDMNTGALSPSSYNTWRQVGAYPEPPNFNARTIARIIDFDQQRFVAGFDDYELRWTGRWKAGYSGAIQTAAARQITITKREGCTKTIEARRHAEIRGTPDCKIKFTFLKAGLVDNSTSPPDVQLLVNGSSPFNIVIKGSSESAGGSITQRTDPTEEIDIIDLTGVTTVQMASIKPPGTAWQFRIEKYYDSGSNLQTFKKYNEVTRSFDNKPVIIDVDLRGLPNDPTDCVFDRGGEPCPTPSNTDYTINNPGSRTRANRINNSFSYRYVDYLPPDSNPVLRNGRGRFKAIYPSFELNQADLPGVLRVLPINGHTEDTSTGLTTDPFSDALLQIEFDPGSIQSGLPFVSVTPYNDPSSPHPYPNPRLWGDTNGSPSYSLALSATVYELDSTYNRIRTVGSTSATFNRAEDRQLRVRDSSPNTSAIRTYEWAFSWTLSVSQSYKYTLHVPRVESDSSGSWVKWDSNDVSLGSINANWNGNWGRNSANGNAPTPCSRALTIQPPTCQIYDSPLRYSDYQRGVQTGDIRTERFNPNTVGATTGLEELEAFPVGRTIARTQVKVANYNPFSLRTNSGQHPTFDVNGDSPYHSGYNPYNDSSSSKSSSIHIRYYEAGDNRHIEYYHEPKNAINYPGKYETLWTVNWQTDTQYSQNWPGGSANDWSGGEHQDNRCAPGAQLSKIIYVYADPPVCEVEDFLFEVGDPVFARVTLKNPNHAPMRIGSADWVVSRYGNSRTGGFVDLQIPPANNANPGERVLAGNVGKIGTSGEFTANWSIKTNMGIETWTTGDKGQPPQNSWFANRDERIFNSGGDICESVNSGVVVKPFIKVFYGSLSAGGQFGEAAEYNACGENFARALGGNRLVNSFVAGHAEGSGPPDARGSSVEYSLQANSIINGFYSASQRNTSPQPMTGLTLSNTNINPSTNPYGGSFGKKTCLANYWREVEKLDPEEDNPSPLILDLDTLDNNDRRRYDLSSAETLEILNKDGTPLNGLKATVYVDGDINITSDIINDSTTRWYDPSEIGYITIIVKGDINIAPNVKQIDALLVAYPHFNGHSMESGIIRTCHYDDINASNQHFHTCNKQLTINGAVVAEKVLFGRTYGSVIQETDFPADPSNTQASEIINLMPEYFIGIPELPLFPDQIYKTDSVSTRPANF